MSSTRDDSAIVDEQALLEGLKAGDDRAYEMLIRAFGARLLAVARRLVRNEEDARDVVQTAYLSVFRGIHSFQRQAQVSTWLHRIVVNAALMKIRSARRKPETSIEDLLPQFLEDGHHTESFHEWETPADELLVRAETRNTVRACINQLPPQYRTVLILRDIEELSTQEAADALGVTATALKVRLHRARQALSTLLRLHYAARSVL